MKGMIALDIDGTITCEARSTPEPVLRYLESLVSDGWVLAFITGRIFSHGFHAIEKLRCPYYFAVQNGALILEMPERRLVEKRYLDTSVFGGLEAICVNEPTDFVIFSGYENQERCFFRPGHFSEELSDYLKKRQTEYDESWVEVAHFSSLPITQFPSVKCFGGEESTERIGREIEEKLGLHAPVVRDPFNPRYFVVQVTHRDVNKGAAVQSLVDLAGVKGAVIAAGDDLNDIPMLERATVSVVMSTAPCKMLEEAQIIAPAAEQMGIIEGLTSAIEEVQ